MKVFTAFVIFVLAGAAVADAKVFDRFFCRRGRCEARQAERQARKAPTQKEKPTPVQKAKAKPTQKAERCGLLKRWRGKCGK